ncbi:MAG: biotin transporter BioY [Syntrophaceae bacterium]
MKMQTLALIPLFAALTAAGALIRLPLWPVPVTMQTFCVLLSGVVLGARAGSLSQLVYLVVGLMGLPVFSGGGGPAYVMTPSFGYLLGFILAPAVVASVIGKSDISVLKGFIAALAGTAAIYAVGFPYLAFYLKVVAQKPDALRLAVQAGVLVFLPGDILKCLLLAVAAPRLRL